MPGARPFGVGAGDAGDADDPAGQDRDRVAFPAASMMSMAAMMPAMAPALAPFVLGSRLARVVDDAGQVAAQVRDSLARDEGPVHVVVGDPDGPLGLSIGLTFMTRSQRSRLTGADAPAGEIAAGTGTGPVVDVAPSGKRVA